MRSYTFRHVDGHVTTVRARTEAVARDAAMRLRWGPPSGMYAGGYVGRGLVLVERGAVSS